MFTETLEMDLICD